MCRSILLHLACSPWSGMYCIEVQEARGCLFIGTARRRHGICAEQLKVLPAHTKHVVGYQPLHLRSTLRFECHIGHKHHRCIPFFQVFFRLLVAQRREFHVVFSIPRKTQLKAKWRLQQSQPRIGRLPPLPASQMQIRSRAHARKIVHKNIQPTHKTHSLCILFLSADCFP